MTAAQLAQLAHLAELAAFAADYFPATDPCAARMFGDTALRADTLSAELRRDETRSRKGTEIGDPHEGWEPG
jgi:hypothetical protein